MFNCFFVCECKNAMPTHKSNFIDKDSLPSSLPKSGLRNLTTSLPVEKQLDVEDPATLPKGLPLGHITEGEGEFDYNP